MATITSNETFNSMNSIDTVKDTESSESEALSVESQDHSHPDVLQYATDQIQLAEIQHVDTDKQIQINSNADTDDYGYQKQQPDSNDPLQPDSNILNTLDIDIQLQMQNKIESQLMHDTHVWIRIFVLILTILLTLLSISYTFGAVSSTTLKVVTRCPEYTLEEIWSNSWTMASEEEDPVAATSFREGDPLITSCWTTSTLRSDMDSIYQYNTYQYQSRHGAFSMFQCAIFSIFTLYCVCILIYGVYSLIIDIKAIKQHKLYTTAPKFKHFLQNTNTNNTNAKIVHSQRQHPILAYIRRWKYKYDAYLGVDTNGYIARMIIVEIWEIIIQTAALLFYNGFNIFDTDGVYLANSKEFIILFACVLSFNCMIVGILWLSYVAKPNKCHGLTFKLCSFCIDQCCDFFYAIFPFIVIFDQKLNLETDALWIWFGLLNNETVVAFIYSAFPMLLLCTKSLLLTRSAIRGMRNKSYDIWLVITKVMNAPNHQNIAYIEKMFGVSITNVQKGDTSPIDDEIYDRNGKLKLNIATSAHNTYSKPKSIQCRISIGIIGICSIIYSIVLLSLVMNHIIESDDYCNGAQYELDIIENHPELYVYDACFTKVYPFRFSKDKAANCDCRSWGIRWDDMDIPVELTAQSILDAVLTQWTMLEKFASSGSPINQSREFELKATHFRAIHMKVFSWQHFDIVRIDEAISNWIHLEYFAIENVNSLMTLPSTFSDLSQLKVFVMAASESVANFSHLLCNLKELIVVEIRGGLETVVPHCISNLDNLEKLHFKSNRLTAFSLGILNMTNLGELNLWDNYISYDDILSYNGYDSDSDPLLYYINSSVHMDIFLHLNPLCEEFPNSVPVGAGLWMGATEVCMDSECFLEAPVCDPSDLGNGVCDSMCNSTSCYMDNGDCFQFCMTQTNCTHAQFLNLECDEECNNEECYWDNYLCKNETATVFTVDGTLSPIPDDDTNLPPEDDTNLPPEYDTDLTPPPEDDGNMPPPPPP